MTEHHKTEKHTREVRTDKLIESDFADEKMGKNSMQGNDQSQVRNQRHAIPGAKAEAEGVVESFRKEDKHERTGK